MSETTHDVIVVGAGVAGAVLTKHLTDRGLKVLVLEAGDSTAQSVAGYERHIDTFLGATAKGPESAWPPSTHAPQPDTGDLKSDDGYFVQRGPQLYGSSYTRAQGGSTLHWLGVSLRMLPEDFSLASRHGVGRDWPLGYDDLEAYYRQAEFDLGVSADVADQRYHGLTFADGYDYPMHRVPLSYSDQWLGEAIEGLRVSMGDSKPEVRIRSYPAARNSMPREGFRPVGAVDRQPDGTRGQSFLGERCQGNTSCTPICPVQAKYNAGRTLGQIDPTSMELRARAVATRIEVDPESGEVRSIVYRRWDENGSEEQRAHAKCYVLAAHAVENAMLMLKSGLAGERGLVGRHLMDHPTLYAYGLAPKPVGAFRGPLSTAGVEEFRAGDFRGKHAAFRFDVGNDGWRAPAGAPESTVRQAALEEGLYGKALRDALASRLSRQVRFSLAVEQLPDPENRVTLDPKMVDAHGNPRPCIDYRIDEYTMGGMAEASRVARAIFARAGVEDHSDDEGGSWFPTVRHGDRVFRYHGMGHFGGTHLMGRSSADSVLDADQRHWEHRNLFMIGSGSFPTMGTSNPTLTIAALAVRTAERLADELQA